jgi:chaperone modulatory protein CbpM
MNTQLSDSTWLNDTDVCQIEHLAEVSGLSIEEIEDLIENGVIVPAEPSAPPRFFQLRYVMTVKTARRLRDDFELDRHGVTLALTLLRRIGELEAELNTLQAKVGRSA